MFARYALGQTKMLHFFLFLPQLTYVIILFYLLTGIIKENLVAVMVDVLQWLSFVNSCLTLTTVSLSI